ncbi:hypothetical protein [Planotetraspora phitsanulokensis]|uniref:hypothetical protein n=1 Tax=Planotetraspora phitsanulokensis TaxID=575192 RepID=UPI00194EEEE0|nr:hypothetical protein [Planotetraspora phitsanulokensis]
MFDGSALEGHGLDPGRATFISCSFLDASLVNLNFMDAEFVDCVFSGRIESVTFSADPWSRDAELGREKNRYQGNDFSTALMRNVSFRGGIDLDMQRFPDTADYFILRDAAAGLDKALRDVERWEDPKDRSMAKARIKAQKFNVQGGQRDLFIHKSLITSKLSPEGAEKLMSIFRDLSAAG